MNSVGAPIGLNLGCGLQAPPFGAPSVPHFNDFHSHQWMYDLTSLTHLMRSAGFVDLQGKTAGESAIENIAEVEDASRILNGAGICVEGRKP